MHIYIHIYIYSTYKYIYTHTYIIYIHTYICCIYIYCIWLYFICIYVRVWGRRSVESTTDIFGLRCLARGLQFRVLRLGLKTDGQNLEYDALSQRICTGSPQNRVCHLENTSKFCGKFLLVSFFGYSRNLILAISGTMHATRNPCALPSPLPCCTTTVCLPV